jgi:hypothetical protein
MKKLLIPLLLLAACSQQGGQDGGNETAPAQQAKSAPAQPPRLATLVGLYEGGAGSPKNQMCVVEGKGGEARFGLVVWGGNLHSCSGAGTVDREGDRLRLAMAGDSACTVEAVISGRTIRMPEQTPPGCAYYCGARASLGGAELTQTGTGEADAMKAKDLVGDPLCATEGR